MNPNRPGDSRPDTALLRRILLVLLAAFALAELPAAAGEARPSPAPQLAAVYEERRVNESAERTYAASPPTEYGLNCTAVGCACTDAQPADGADPAAATLGRGPTTAPPPGGRLHRAVAPEPILGLPPCKAVHSRAPPAFA